MYNTHEKYKIEMLAIQRCHRPNIAKMLIGVSYCVQYILVNIYSFKPKRIRQTGKAYERPL